MLCQLNTLEPVILSSVLKYLDFFTCSVLLTTVLYLGHFPFSCSIGAVVV